MHFFLCQHCLEVLEGSPHLPPLFLSHSLRPTHTRSVSPPTCQIIWHSKARREAQSPFRSSPEWSKLTLTYEAHFSFSFHDESLSKKWDRGGMKGKGKSNFMLMDSRWGKKKRTSQSLGEGTTWAWLTKKKTSHNAVCSTTSETDVSIKKHQSKFKSLFAEVYIWGKHWYILTKPH